MTGIEGFRLDFGRFEVDRDDMEDQGAAHVAATVRQLKERQPTLKVETLIGDFQGKLELVEQARGQREMSFIQICVCRVRFTTIRIYRLYVYIYIRIRM